MTTWNVTLHKQGARLDIQVEAQNQNEARRIAGYRYPSEAGYKVTSAQRV
jgi:hypothetical protein